MKISKQKINLTLDKEIIDQIKKSADITSRSVSMYVNTVFKKLISGGKINDMNNV